MKSLIIASAMTLLTIVGTAHATHELKSAPVANEESDGHISWHEFRHELLAYPSVNASMNQEGVITIIGHTNSRYGKNEIDRLANRVRGATEVDNSILTD